MDTGKTCVIIILSLLALFEQSEPKGLCEFAEMFPSNGSESCFQPKAKKEEEGISAVKNANDITTGQTFTSNDAIPETNNPTSTSASNFRCPENMVYGNCSCQSTCQDPRNETSCVNECTEEFKCVCPVEFLMTGGDCVPEKTCNCFIDGGGVIKDGGSFVYPNCSTICFCDNDHLTCEEYNCSANATCQEIEGVYQCQCNKGFSGDGRICVTAPTDCMELFVFCFLFS